MKQKKYTVVGVQDCDFECPMLYHLEAESPKEAIGQVHEHQYPSDVVCIFEGHLNFIFPEDIGAEY